MPWHKMSLDKISWRKIHYDRMPLHKISLDRIYLNTKCHLTAYLIIKCCLTVFLISKCHLNTKCHSAECLITKCHQTSRHFESQCAPNFGSRNFTRLNQKLGSLKTKRNRLQEEQQQLRIEFVLGHFLKKQNAFLDTKYIKIWFAIFKKVLGNWFLWS